MKFQILYFELLLALEILVRTAIPSILNWPISLAIYSLILLLKGIFEGFRLHWPLLILALALSLTSIISLHITALIIVLFSVLYFPLYSNLKPSGPYEIGYREIWLNNGFLHVSIFYPTTTKGPDALQFSGKIPPWKNLQGGFKLATKGNLPSWYIKIGLSYLNHRKLGVNSDVPISSRFVGSQRGFPVILFSHGLAVNRNAYSFYLKEWASHGFIVFSPDHHDIIVPSSGKVEDFEHRNVDLRKRLNDQKAILDFIGRKDGLENLMGGKIEIDHSSISAIGHSYGGGTAAYLSLLDQRITGACVCMDPWYFALEEEVYKSVNRPLLVITTKDFQKNCIGNLERIIRLSNLNGEFRGQTMVCSFEGAVHNNLADNGLFMPREAGLIGGLCKLGLVEKMFRNNAGIIEAFLEVTVLERGKQEGNIEKILERYKQKKHYPEIRLTHEETEHIG